MMKIMPRNEQNSEATPHFDGENENVINDSTAMQGKQMGIVITADEEFTQDQNPYHFSNSQTNEKMEDFEEIMRGNKINNKIRK
jgi:hypothetical protein